MRRLGQGDIVFMENVSSWKSAIIIKTHRENICTPPVLLAAALKNDPGHFFSCFMAPRHTGTQQTHTIFTAKNASYISIYALLCSSWKQWMVCEHNMLETLWKKFPAPFDNLWFQLHFCASRVDFPITQGNWKTSNSCANSESSVKKGLEKTVQHVFSLQALFLDNICHILDK